jgi:hypothetical protein
LVVEPLALVLDVFDRAQTQLERGGLQGSEHFARD